VRALAGLLTDITFRSAEVRRRGKEPTGPALILASHAGGLADILLVIHASTRFPRFLARDLIWRVPLGAQVMEAVGGIPVHRRQDHAGGVDNSGMFDAAFDALAEGDVAAIYPEGESVSEPHLAPLRTGAARIAVGALERGTDVVIVPLGLHFFDVSVLRSRAMVDCAEPFRISEVVDQLGVDGPISENNHPLVHAVTEVFADRLGAVSSQFDDWENLRRMEVAATTYLQEQRPGEVIPYSEIASLTGQLAHAPLHLRHEVDLAATAYVSELELLGVGPLDVPRVAMISARLAGEAAAVMFLAPAAAVGFVINAVGIVGLRLISLSGIAPATAATVKPAYALVAFPLTWAALGYLGFRRFGSAGAALMALTGPVGLVAAVRVGERGQLLWRLGRAVHRARGPLLDQITASRSSVLAAVSAAAAATATATATAGN
jgi:1-acyl-sn-glycerol-3-phosphate acyltransferase